MHWQTGCMLVHTRTVSPSGAGMKVPIGEVVAADLVSPQLSCSWIPVCPSRTSCWESTSAGRSGGISFLL